MLAWGMATVYLALGSNVGDAQAHIDTAIELLSAKIRGIKRAPLYRSKAVGYTDQADFTNTAIGGQTELSPKELLTFTQEVEQKVGRIKRFRWGPREIDVDLIFYDDRTSDTPELTLPHPAFRERDFVLQPLKDLNPELTDPQTGRTVTELLADLPTAAKSILNKVD